jgi:hypothetical protein
MKETKKRKKLQYNMISKLVPEDDEGKEFAS